LGGPMPAVDTLVTVVDETDLEFAMATRPEIKTRRRLRVTLGAQEPDID